MEGKIRDLKKVLSQDPGDTKLLQMQLQGAISTSVNVVSALSCFHMQRIWERVGVYEREKGKEHDYWLLLLVVTLFGSRVHLP